MKNIDKEEFRIHFVFNAAIVLVIVFGTLYTIYRGQTADNAYREFHLRQASEIAMTIHPDMAKKLSFLPSDTLLPEFHQIRRQLKAYSKIIHNEIYSLGLSQGILHFGPESHARDEKYSSSPGLIFKQPSPEDFGIFIDGRPSFTGPVTDEYGTFISSMVPVLDPANQQVIMVIGLDDDTTEWQKTVLKAKLTPALLTLFILLLVISAYIYTLKKTKNQGRGKPLFLEALIIGITGLFISTVVAVIDYDKGLEKRTRLFEIQATPYLDKLRTEFHNIELNQFFIRNFFTSSQKVDSTEFQDFFHPVVFDNPNVTYLWAPWGVNKKGTPSCRVRYHAPNENLILPYGFDLYAVPIYRKAMKTARSLSRSVAVKPVSDLPLDSLSGIRITFFPVFKPGNIEQDSGFIVTVLDFKDIMKRVIHPGVGLQPEVALDLVEIDSAGQMNTIFREGVSEEASNSFFTPGKNYHENHKIAFLSYFNSTFAAIAHENEWFIRENVRSIWWIPGLFLFILSLILAYIIHLQRKKQLVLDQEVRKKTSALQSAKNEAEINALRFRKMIESAPLAIIIVDPEGIPRYINKSFERLLGYKQQDIPNPETWWTKTCPNPEYREKILKEWSENFASSKQTGDVFLSERSYQLNAKGGETKEVLIAATYILDDLLLIFTDVTPLNKANQELLVAKQKAEESDRFKSILLLNLSHELRTPLTTIVGYGNLLFNGLTGTEDRKMARYIIHSGNLLLNTFNAIHKLARLESGNQAPESVMVNVSVLIKNQLEQFRDIAKTKKITLRENLRDNVLLSTDQEMLQDILSFLIDNAVKFTSAGYVWIALEMNEEQEGKNRVEISIKDTGIGIPVEKQEQIFMAFRQVSEGMGRSYGGIGLGLTLTKKFCDLLGCEIQMNSIPGTGTTFTLIFHSGVPGQEEKPETHPEMELLSLPVTPHETDSDKPRILIVEDNPANAELAARFLGKDFSTDTAYNGLLAVKYAFQNPYDLILMDINLGSEMDGIKTTSEIRSLKNYSRVPVIAVTGYSTPDEKDYILNQGLDDFLSKPYTRDELLYIVNKHLQLSSQKP